MSSNSGRRRFWLKPGVGTPTNYLGQFLNRLTAVCVGLAGALLISNAYAQDREEQSNESNSSEASPDESSPARRSASPPGALIRFDIHKSFIGPGIPGAYSFLLNCHGPDGLAKPPISVSVVLPVPGFSSVNLPDGFICGVTESQPAGNWDPPTFLGANNLPISPGGPWQAKVGPMNGNSAIRVINKRKPGGENVSFSISKGFIGTPVAGTYVFNLSCHGPTGNPVPVSSPVSIVYPGSGPVTVTIPFGANCHINEMQPAGNWSAPTFTGSNVAVMMGGPWAAKVGPVTNSNGGVRVLNKPKPQTETARFQIIKSFKGKQVAGSYWFNVNCSGPGGPYTGPNPVEVVYPSPGASMVNVPAGSNCVVVETQPAGNWTPPAFAGSGVNVMMGGPWNAKVGPINGAGGAVKVTNYPKPSETGTAKLTIRKIFSGPAVAGTYSFFVSCQGPGGPFTGNNPVNVGYPSPGTLTINVPVGSVCTFDEAQPAAGNWNAPIFVGGGVPVLMTTPWHAKVGPFGAQGGALTVTNQLKGAQP